MTDEAFGSSRTSDKCTLVVLETLLAQRISFLCERVNSGGVSHPKDHHGPRYLSWKRCQSTLPTASVTAALEQQSAD